MSLQLAFNGMLYSSSQSTLRNIIVSQIFLLRFHLRCWSAPGVHLTNVIFSEWENTKQVMTTIRLRTIVFLSRSTRVLYFDFRAKTWLEKIGGGHWVAFWGNHLKAEVVISSREWFGDQSRGGRKRGWRDKKSHSGRHYLLPRPPPNTTTRQKSLRNRPRLYENLHVRAEL